MTERAGGGTIRMIPLTPYDKDGGLVVGARVERPVNVFATSSPVRVGTVTRRYSQPGYDELYEVVWDTEGGRPIEPLTCVGYFRHGLSVSWKQSGSRAGIPTMKYGPIGPADCL